MTAPRTPIGLDQFEVRLARDAADLRAAQALRYKVFVEEVGADVSAADKGAGLERDAFDAHADHLLLIDKEGFDGGGPRVVGVYRLMTDHAAATGIGFYGASEYDLAPLMQPGRRLLELGRSCVDAAYRGGAAIHLLWTGLAEYVLTHRIDVMFGTASFPGANPEPLGEALAFLRQNYRAPQGLRVSALPGRGVPMDRVAPEEIDRRRAPRQIPPLMKAYLRLGGHVSEDAFVDHAFNTVDVLLLLETASMKDRYRRLLEARVDATGAGMIGAGA